MKKTQRFKRIVDYHRFAHIASPLHPLISLIDYSQVQYPENLDEAKWIQEYYTIGLKRNVAYKLFYGQKEYDFDEGLMTFIAPNQVIRLGNNPNIKQPPSGWLLLIHPDFFWGSPLAREIKHYDFFGYGTNEALFLSPKEEKMMVDILRSIEQEYVSNIDKFSQKIVLSQIELLLSYAERFYERQFITRKISNHHLLEQLEALLDDFFEKKQGQPEVTWVAAQLNLSPNYLSSVLKSLTGQNTQQHIQNTLILKAKEQLSTTLLSVSEIAYDLGFEHPSSFSKLFKNKTSMSPLEFRKTFN